MSAAVHAIYRRWREGERVRVAPELSGALRQAGIDLNALEIAEGAKPPLLELPERPLRVALFGHGTVGGGVYRLLAALPGYFCLAGVAVREPRKHDIAAENRCWRVLRRPCDVIVELIGGVRPAARLIETALKLGRHVVTANKAVIAEHGPRLEAIARARNVRLLYSASVGGALPALETLRRHSPRVREFSGVLNATSNFVLDEMARGQTLAEAVAEAQQKGYAEADPTLDLDGTDAAQKLFILARAAFGRAPDRLRKCGILGVEAGEAVRLVARCWKAPDGRIEAEVMPRALPSSHPLASTVGPENRLLVELCDAPPLLVRGTGAGRWPTAEAVMADLFDLRDAHALR